MYRSLTDDSLYRIDADLLIPGQGEPLLHGAVVWKSKSILYVGRQTDVPQEYQDAAASHVPVVMPGLWDCHIHYMGATSATMDAVVKTTPALAGARSVPDLHATIMAGFTSVREVGGYGCELALAVNEGRILGPTIYGAHSAISMTAGHGDVHGMPLHQLQDMCAHGLPLTIADGVPDCLQAVRKQLRHGARVIKVCASGGVVSAIDDPQHQEFSFEEMKAIVDEAARAKRVVAAHCHGKAGIMNALRAGCRTIEHGSFLDEEAVELMREKGAILVATRSVIETGLSMRQLFTPGSYQKLLEVADAHKQAYRLAVARGVTIALGTDQFISSDNPAFAYGRNGKELEYAVEAGMTPLAAIEAATANGPLTLGDQAPKSGRLLAGYDADIIALAANPLEDITIIGNSKNVTHVWRQGKSVKS
ncbi:metal-dependent hydrolase family protein [Aspergillus brunneoviolaceus CBS 621.78]|uniref:Uncharacterized protein n=1 Tax=Aspergillus brunneoviolaceus CBS 621.78 TaxID=1450534 RepID=A0ACD1GJC7_9EURO|nr:hypothetical protein BO95DRAFT_13933 [Aspergillus brunneoviolaceus CBS 621.78]RAH49328.1 hypothetical protein BO95DRAFT_13933 [Aspergillus brunneoviolaceus CBS 621.78]